MSLATMVPKGWVVVGLTNGMLDRKYLHVQKLHAWRASLAPIGQDLSNDPMLSSKWPTATAETPELALEKVVQLARSFEQEEKK